MKEGQEDSRCTRPLEKYSEIQVLNLQANFSTMKRFKSYIQTIPEPQDILFMSPQYKAQVYIDKAQHLGKGSYNNVYSALLRNLRNQLIPAVIKEAKYTKKQWQQGFSTSYECQVDALCLLSNCPSAIKLYGAFYVGSRDRRLCILLEKCTMSLEDCFNLVRNSASLALKVFHTLIDYLAFAHNINQTKNQQLRGSGIRYEYLVQLKKRNSCVLHKDLKPANILVRKLQGQTIDIAVADFGMAAACESYNSTFCSLYGGTIRYESPEIQVKKEYDSKSDCWSFGILMHSLFCKTIKLEAMNYAIRIKSMREIASNIKQDMRQIQFPYKQVAIYILQHCLQFSRQNRWFSHSIKAVWDHRDELGYIQLQKPSVDARRSIHDLIFIQVTLLEKISQKTSKLERRSLQKIASYNQQLLQYLIQSNPMFLPELHLPTLRSILDQRVVDSWENKRTEGTYLLMALEAKNKQQLIAPSEKKLLCQHLEIIIANLGFSQNEKERVHRFIDILNKTA